MDFLCHCPVVTKVKQALKQPATIFALTTIMIIGGIFRFSGLNWDQNQHLHPDERFLTMVVNDISMPYSLINYFQPDSSSLNPTNIQYDFFVYGHFPVNLNKFLATTFGYNQYNPIALGGRFLSASFDLLVILLIYKTALLLAKKISLPADLKLWAPLVYALLVLPIQYSHFYTVDSFLNFFCFLSFYAALNYRYQSKKKWLLLTAVGYAFALASKISALYILPLLLWLIANQENRLLQTLLALFSRNKKPQLGKLLTSVALDFVQLTLATYLILRIADPYLFKSANWLNPSLHPLFIENIKKLQMMSTQTGYYPPGIQWLNTQPIIFSAKNIFFFGAGVVPSLLLLAGLGLIYLQDFKKLTATIKTKSTDNFVLLVVASWVISYFLYQSWQLNKNIRYFLILYPFFALIAGRTLSAINYRLRKSPVNFLAVVSLLFALAIWPLMFLSIYIKPHSRVTASHWIYQNLEDQSLILAEHWDDALPVHLEGYDKDFTIKQLPVFAPDNQEKWGEIKTLLNKGDYYILSSNRGWGSITKVPDKYPVMSRFYQQLLANQTPYKKIAEFNSYPSLEYLGIPIYLNDQLAEEAFTVYDHPKVMIFENRIRQNEFNSQTNLNEANN